MASFATPPLEVPGVTTPAPGTPAPAAPPAAPATPTIIPGNADSMADYLKQRMSPQPPTGRPDLPATPPAAVPAAPAPAAGEGAPSTPASPAIPAPAAPATPAPTTPPSLDEFSFDDEEGKPAAGAPATPATPAAGAPPADPNAPPADPNAPATPPADPNAPASEDGVTRLKELLDSGGMPKEVESAFLATGRGRKVLAVFKAMRDLEAPPESGGIGTMPTTDQIKNWYQANANWEAMNFDLETNPASFIANILGRPDESGKVVPFTHTRAIAENFLPTLLKIDPSLARVAAAPAINSWVEQLYHDAANCPAGQEVDEFGVDSKSRLLDAARIFERRTLGKNRPVPGAPAAPGATTPPANDPLAQEREQLRLEREAIARQRQETTNAQIESFQSAVFSEIHSAIESDVDKLAATYGVKDAFPSTQMYALWRDQFINDVYLKVAGNSQTGVAPFNPIAFQSFTRSLEQASRRALGAASPDVLSIRKNLTDSYRQIARTAIRMLAPTHVQVAGAKITAASPTPESITARTTALAGTQEPAAGGGAPPARSVVLPGPVFEVKPGEDRAEAMQRFLREKMSTAAAAR